MKQVKDAGLRAVAIGAGVIVLAAVVIGVFRFQPHAILQGALPPSGPRVPIPTVDAATLVQGEAIYKREKCTGCHSMTGVPIGGVPDLLHEGRRNADIAWQMSNLREHKRIHPNSDMGNYDKLSPDELRALASYMATRN
ncbi:MAG: cytochrome c [Capsulimonas sp.]|uniref:c-type cytochrome n=1 Tax=Capsulimonas sp. TaxID=2494211 RepID=UPI003263DA4A